MEMKVWSIFFVFWIGEFKNVYKWKKSNKIFTWNILYKYTAIYESIYKCYFMKFDLNKSLCVKHNILYIKYFFYFDSNQILNSESNFYYTFLNIYSTYIFFSKSI